MLPFEIDMKLEGPSEDELVSINEKIIVMKDVPGEVELAKKNS